MRSVDGLASQFDVSATPTHASVQPVSQPVSTPSCPPLHLAQMVFAVPPGVSQCGDIPLSALPHNAAQPAPLTACVSSHSDQIVQTGSAAHFDETVAMYDVEALHRDTTLHRDAAAPITFGHISPRTASQMRILPLTCLILTLRSERPSLSIRFDPCT